MKRWAGLKQWCRSRHRLVSASDVTSHGPLAERLMHMVHLSGNTSGVSKASSDWLNYTGFPGEVCVAFLNVPPGNKDAVTQNPLTKEESRCVYNCDYERLSGSTKCWIFKSMRHFLILWHRIFKIHPRVSHTGLLLWQHFHAPKRDCDWLFDVLVKRPHGRALANERGHLFQTFSGQSEGLATRDYRHWSSSVEAEFSTLLHHRVAQSTSCHFGRLSSI